MLRYLILMIPMLAIGCSTTSSGVMNYGNNNYSIATSSEYGLSQAKKEAVTEANKFCSSIGKTMQPVSTDSGSEQGCIASTSITYDLVFSCQ